jgi:uncharacterized protein
MGDLVVVFDTVVFVRALINPFSFWGRLVFEHRQDYRLIVSPQIMREVVEVLQRPELTSRFTALQGIDVTRILEILQQAEASRDAKDNKFLAAAEIAKADYLVSEDRDLLDLTEHQGTRVIPAHEFLQILKTLRKAA